MTQPRHTDILIIGGGFGGMNAALVFDKLLKRKLDASVTLISRTNFYLFTPLVAEVAASLVEPRHAVNSIRRMLRRVRFIEGTVDRIDAEGREVSFVDETGTRRSITYEHCVMAPGSVTEFFGIEGLAENAFTLKTLGDAIRIRNHVVRTLERADSLEPEERGDLLTFAVVGGGLNGTEVCGELHDFVMRAIEDYPTVTPDEVRMVLIEMLPRLAQELPQEIGTYCRRNLESRGIECWLESKVTGYRDGVLHVERKADGEDGAERELWTDMVLWTAGVRPSPLINQVEAEPVEDADDRLPADEFLRVRGHENLWIVGDCALIPNPEGHRQPYQPPTAQHAVRQGRHVARNIRAAMSGHPPKPFRYGGIGMLATLGRHRGVGRVYGIRMVGFPAWFAWRTYYLFALPRWERRLRVAFDWALDLLFPPDIVELKVEPLQTGIEAGAAGRPPEGRGEEDAETTGPPDQRVLHITE
jgi:NADH dehydrogenase